MPHPQAAHGLDDRRERLAAGSKPVPQWSLEGLLRELVDKDSYPRLYRIAWSGEIDSAPSGYDEQQEFAFGLERILDGVQVLIDRTTGEMR
jgi:hypothetical protein